MNVRNLLQILTVTLVNQMEVAKSRNYYTDDHGGIHWDYEDACNTWYHLRAMYVYRKDTLEKARSCMYEALIEKLDQLYRHDRIG